MKKCKNNIKFSNLFIVLAFFCFAIIIYRVVYLATAKEIDGIDIKVFADDRKIYESVIPATRGDILDTNSEVLATTVSTYKLIAYIDPIRSEGESKLYHVEDKETTAKELSKILGMDEEEIYYILNQEGLYQVEFGSKGKNLTQSQKEKIDSLNLPGIDFIESKERYYPNGDFASYTLGYARSDEYGVIEGELGLESVLNEQLKGKDGYTSYQVDVNNYKIAGTKEIKEEAEDGLDVYLTIDSNIQYIVEQALNEASKKYDFEWIVAVVCDAKTGKILATSQKPSFNPNPKELDIKNYLDLSVANPFEPGSIMKIYTYMAAMEAGTYDGNAKFKSGGYKVDDDVTIYDWLKQGWGMITYDQGFMASSNVGVINIVNEFIDRDTLYKYFKKLGFGEKTNITLANEQAGKLSFYYDSEVYNAAFGQGITTTPMQHIKALTSIANDGVMLNPYIIDKVVTKKGEVIYEGKKEELGVVASKETTDYIKNLMYDTVHSSWSGATGTSYKLKGYDLIGKTGTAQLVNPNTGKYYTSYYQSIRSFVGMWPKDNPEVIIYMSVKKSEFNYPLVTAVKSIVKNVSTYLNIFDTQSNDIIENKKIENYLNKEKEEVLSALQKENIDFIVIGDGNKIVNQYPTNDYLLSSNEKVILVTNGTYKMPNLKGYSKKEVRAVCDMLDLNCTLEGFGYAISQSIKTDAIIKTGNEIKIIFKELY
ncbi:MAG: penicillin-binding protein [bacterium]|nr:penicillin-binding protein [bacterium]